MYFEEYQALAARTINPELNAEQQEMHALHGMVGEVGELHSIYQKVFQGHNSDPTHIKKELGDLLWFVAEFCTSHGWNMGEIAKMNVDKLYSRYPGGFEVARSLIREKGDI